MNIKIHYSRVGVDKIKKPIGIKVDMRSNQNIVFEEQFIIVNTGVLEFFCDYPPKMVDCRFHCEDLDIFHHPMIIEMIEFDDFYQLHTYAHHGINHYDEQFIKYATNKNLFLEDTKFNNCLFFTGYLSYQWPRPITQMILHPPATVFCHSL